MEYEEYVVGQQVILRGPLKCLQETWDELSNDRTYMWTPILQSMVNLVVMIQDINYEDLSGYKIPTYAVSVDNNNNYKISNFRLYHHWLTPIEDDTFGFLYKKE